jgi:hypothetical protein
MYFVHRGLINNKYLPRSVKHDPDLNRQKANMWSPKKKRMQKVHFLGTACYHWLNAGFFEAWKTFVKV